MKDRFENEIETGNMMLAKLSQPYVIGRVVQLKPGGLSLGRDPRVKTADVIVIACEFAVIPGAGEVMVLKEPDRKSVTEN